MFQNKTAWFSNSVPQETHNFWRKSVRLLSSVSEMGTVASWRAADYLFSADAECPDTLRIFQSKDYLWNKVTVFHKQFLSTCERRQSTKSVCIGHYVLPPASVQDEVRNEVGRFLWECEEEQEETQESESTLDPLTEDEDSLDEISKIESNSSHEDSSENQTPRSRFPINHPVCSELTEGCVLHSSPPTHTHKIELVN
uniref:Telomere repeats-binding bouquet formation protein 2 n=1 Tax=Gouania willdenowi TaxID=441366 RepID=A0A8C5NF86_GOUWI